MHDIEELEKQLNNIYYYEIWVNKSYSWKLVILVVLY